MKVALVTGYEESFIISKLTEFELIFNPNRNINYDVWKTVKANISHICCNCREPIKKNDLYSCNYRFLVTNNKPYRICSKCCQPLPYIKIKKTLSKEHKRKIGLARKGHVGWNKGLHHSEETKRKMRDAWKKRHNEGKANFSLEHRKKISLALLKNNGFRGKHHTKETKKRISKNLIGEKNGMYGKKHKLETIQKNREAQLKAKPIWRNTSIELKMQNELKKRNITFLTHKPVLKTCIPDIVFLDKKIAVFCDGDYWHTRNKAIRADTYHNKVLIENGWTPLRFWGVSIRTDVIGCVDIIEAHLQ